MLGTHTTHTHTIYIHTHPLTTHQVDNLVFFGDMLMVEGNFDES